MRKIVLFILFSVCAITSSYAAPCYGSKMPKQKEFFLGLQNHTIFKRYLKDEYGKLRSTQDFLLLSYGIFERLSIDLKGGVGNIRQHPLGSDEIDYPSFLGGGYGFRLNACEAGNLKMVFGFQHISVHPHTVFLGNVKHKAVLDGWQLSFLVSRGFKKITPYIGAKWSRVDYIHWVNGERKREKSDLTKGVGLFLGLDLPLTQKIWLNLEAQFQDTEAVAFSVNYKI